MKLLVNDKIITLIVRILTTYVTDKIIPVVDTVSLNITTVYFVLDFETY